MNIFAWIIQIVLAGIMGVLGMAKVTQPKERLHAYMSWAADFSQPQMIALGVLELLAGLGLLMHGLLPIVTIIAAGVLSVELVLVAVLHFRRQEMPFAIAYVALTTLADLVIFARLVFPLL